MPSLQSNRTPFRASGEPTWFSRINAFGLPQDFNHRAPSRRDPNSTEVFRGCQPLRRTKPQSTSYLHELGISNILRPAGASLNSCHSERGRQDPPETQDL